MRKRLGRALAALARLYARWAVRLGVPCLPGPVVLPNAIGVGRTRCLCGRADCRTPALVQFVVHAGGGELVVLVTPAQATDIGRELVRTGATLQEHHVEGGPL